MKKHQGFTLIEIMVVLAINAIIATVAIPNLSAARARANEASAISSLRTISSEQAMFFVEDSDGDGIEDYARSLTELDEARFGDDILFTGEKQGYCFVILSHTSSSWHAHADPIRRGETGNRSFYIDETGILRWDSTTTAGPTGSAFGDFTDEPSPSPDHQETGEPPSCNRGTGDMGPTTSESTPGFFIHMVSKVSKYVNKDVLNEALSLAQSPQTQQLILQGLDSNQDGMLTFQETLQTDVLDLARKVAGPNSVVIGKDEPLVRALAWFLKKIEHNLSLGIANEHELPSVSIDSMLPQNLPPSNSIEYLTPSL